MNKHKFWRDQLDTQALKRAYWFISILYTDAIDPYIYASSHKNRGLIVKDLLLFLDNGFTCSIIQFWNKEVLDNTSDNKYSLALNLYPFMNNQLIQVRTVVRPKGK